MMSARLSTHERTSLEVHTEDEAASPDSSKLRLYGFNNLTKHLSINLYDVCWSNTELERTEYLAYIDEFYNAKRLTEILTNCSDLIGANILNLASQDYDRRRAASRY